MRLKEEYRTEQVINKSRFITCLKPCRNEEEARAYIEEIRKEFNDSTHVCTAYVCGENNMIRRSSDNKEPSGTAGVPMLEAILNSEIQDVCACVVRYFGGIKLGTGGLVRAYSSSVSNGLKEAPKTIDVKLQQYSITYPYDLSGSIETWLRSHTAVRDFLYDELVTCLFETDDPDLQVRIRDISGGKCEAEFIREVIREKDAE